MGRINRIGEGCWGELARRYQGTKGENFERLKLAELWGRSCLGVGWASVREGRHAER